MVQTCAEPEVFERHLRENTNFDGKIKSIDKVCNACYRFSLLLSRSFKQKKKSCDEEFKSLLESIQNSLGSKPLPFSDEKKIVDYALILSAITIAEKLLKNEALTLPSAHEIFTMHMKYLHPEGKSMNPRWLLCQLSLLFEHHLAYTCILKKHGTILYRSGRELECLSHAIFSLKNYQASETLDYKGVYRDLNQRICMQAEQCKHSKELLDVEDQIKSTDPILWNMVCSITQSKDRFTYEHPQIYDGEIKNLRCLFILHLIMFCVDKTSSLPFHLLLTDVIDTHCLGLRPQTGHKNSIVAIISYFLSHSIVLYHCGRVTEPNVTLRLL